METLVQCTHTQRMYGREIEIGRKAEIKGDREKGIAVHALFFVAPITTMNFEPSIVTMVIEPTISMIAIDSDVTSMTIEPIIITRV